MRLRQFTPRQPIPVIQFTPRQRKSDPEVIIKHDVLSAGAWECEYYKSTFDSDYNNAVTTNSPEITVRSEVAIDGTSSIPGTTREESPEIFPQAGRSCDGMDTDHYMESDANTSVEQPNLTPTNTGSSKYDLRQSPTPNRSGD